MITSEIKGKVGRKDKYMGSIKNKSGKKCNYCGSRRIEKVEGYDWFEKIYRISWFCKSCKRVIEKINHPLNEDKSPDFNSKVLEWIK